MEKREVTFVIQIHGLIREDDGTVIDQGWWDSPWGSYRDEAAARARMGVSRLFSKRLVRRTTATTDETLAYLEGKS